MDNYLKCYLSKYMEEFKVLCIIRILDSVYNAPETSEVKLRRPLPLRSGKINCFCPRIQSLLGQGQYYR